MSDDYAIETLEYIRDHCFNAHDWPHRIEALTIGANALRERACGQDANQVAKADAGKPRPTLVPPQIIMDIAEVREYGCRKYKDPENWKRVEIERYRDAAFRHLLAYIQNPEGKDEESGIEHYKHLACNLAFICAMEHQKANELNKTD